MRSGGKGNRKNNLHLLGTASLPPDIWYDPGYLLSRRFLARPILRNPNLRPYGDPVYLIFTEVLSTDLTSPAHRWWPSLLLGGLLTLVFAALARWLRGVTNSGAVAGAVCCFVLYVGAGPAAVVGLIAVFALAWITTRLGYHRKQKLGVAERREGRNAFQVLANLGVATACAAVLFLAKASPATEE